MADRYAGRHVRPASQARHGAWKTKKRTRSSAAQVVPAAAALTVAGVLIGGASTVIQLGAPAPSPDGESPTYQAATYPVTDRAAAADRVNRGDPRIADAELPTTVPSTVPTSKPEPTFTVVSDGTCKASYYDDPQQTANGETFDPTELTAASKTLPFNTQVRVTNEANGESVVVRINDRGPFVSGRCLDLSEAAFGEIAKLGLGVVDVHYEVLAQDAT